MLISGFNFTGSITISNLKADILYGPYTQNFNDNSIIIVWETNTPTSNNYVEYGVDDNYGFIEEGSSDCNHHEVTIKPDFSNGHYRVFSDGVVSNDFRFKLTSYFDKENIFKCIFIGDSRGSWDNWANAEMVADAVNNESPIFVIHGGDMVDNGRIIEQWGNWLSLMMPLMQNSTVYGILGNHEYNCDRYFEIFSLPNNEKWYSFDYGPFHFVILDNYALWGSNSEQYQWLENDLANSNSFFKIVCFHEPIYCSGGHSPREDVRVVWEPLFIKYNVKLALQSHCHYYQRTNKIEDIFYVVSGGAGGPLYTPSDDWFVNISNECYHYCLLEYDPDINKLKFTAHYLNSSVFDEFYVDPINGPNPPIISGPSTGLPGEEYEFMFKAYDPNNYEIYIKVDWGDGTWEYWLGPYEPGNEIFLKHTWENKNNYEIKAKAKNSDGLESDWSSFKFSMPRRRIANNLFIKLNNFLSEHELLFLHHIKN